MTLVGAARFVAVAVLVWCAQAVPGALYVLLGLNTTAPEAPGYVLTSVPWIIACLAFAGLWTGVPVGTPPALRALGAPAAYAVVGTGLVLLVWGGGWSDVLFELRWGVYPSGHLLAVAAVAAFLGLRGWALSRRGR